MSSRGHRAHSTATSRRARPRAAPAHIRKNLANWQQQSNWYDRRHAKVLGGRKSMAWGLWRIPESRLKLLGSPRGQDILELGCGGARWSIALARRGARVTGVDLSSAQLGHARRLVRVSKSRVRLVRGDAERLPFANGSFDLVFCDWGATLFCDPLKTVPEAARVLRPGGRFVFANSSPFRNLAENRHGYRIGRKLLYDYFDLHRIEYAKEVNFQLPYGEWIRLFTEHGFVVESLTEPRPGPGVTSSYLNRSEQSWARRWPLESIWRVRKVAD